MAFTLEIKFDDATIAALEMTQRGADRDGDYQYLRDAVLAFLEAFVR